MEYEDRYLQAQRPKYDCLVFDIDDTLYPLSSGLAAECRKNIQDYMLERLGIEKSNVAPLCDLLYKKYGTTMAGLRAIGYTFDYDDFHSFVHGRLPYERLEQDPVLQNILLSLPIRKVIFTNADKVHAAKVLNRLGLEGCFEGIICFETLNPIKDSSDETSNDGNVFNALEYFSRGLESNTDDIPKTPVLCKPSKSAMEHALRMANIDPRRTIFFDDNIRNIQSGKLIGLHTVLVGTCHRVKGVDHALENIHNMREALPELWVEVEKSEEVRYEGKVAMETRVMA